MESTGKKKIKRGHGRKGGDPPIKSNPFDWQMRNWRA